MKRFIHTVCIIALLALSSHDTATAAKSAKKSATHVIATISEQKSGDVFALRESGGEFTLVKKQKGRAEAVVKIDAQKARLMQNEMAHVFWETKYRKPASVQKCTEYGTMESVGEKARVCHEDRKATMSLYSLLVTASRQFK
jgi:hypothetical protein